MLVFFLMSGFFLKWRSIVISMLIFIVIRVFTIFPIRQSSIDSFFRIHRWNRPWIRAWLRWSVECRGIGRVTRFFFSSSFLPQRLYCTFQIILIGLFSVVQTYHSVATVFDVVFFHTQNFEPWGIFRKWFLQFPGREINAGDCNRLGRVSNKNIRTKTIIHEIPKLNGKKLDDNQTWFKSGSFKNMAISIFLFQSSTTCIAYRWKVLQILPTGITHFTDPFRTLHFFYFRKHLWKRDAVCRVKWCILGIQVL